jgi:hypothetical protein
MDQQSKTIIGTFGINHDISVITESEAALVQERDMLHITANHSKDAIYFKDLTAVTQESQCTSGRCNLLNLLKMQ